MTPGWNSNRYYTARRSNISIFATLSLLNLKENSTFYFHNLNKTNLRCVVTYTRLCTSCNYRNTPKSTIHSNIIIEFSAAVELLWNYSARSAILQQMLFSQSEAWEQQERTIRNFRPLLYTQLPHISKQSFMLFPPQDEYYSLLAKTVWCPQRKQ